MEFTRHIPGASQAPRPAQPVDSGPAGTRHTNTKNSGWGKWTRIGFASLLFATTILVVALAALIAFGGKNDQTKYINSSKYQAVFINDGSQNGQSVYFGHITKLNSSYLVLENIYYITTSSGSNTSTTSSSSNYSLTKLGCQQLHDPYDQMVINMNQVAFWENLEDSGKVVTAIKQFQKDNPKGPDCSQTTSTTPTSTQNSSTTQNSTTTPSTSSTTKQ